MPDEQPDKAKGNVVNEPRPLPGRKPRDLPGSAPRLPSVAKPDAAPGPSAHPGPSIPSGSASKPILRRPLLLAGLAAATAAGIVAGVVVARRGPPAAPPAPAGQTASAGALASPGPVGRLASPSSPAASPAMQPPAPPTEAGRTPTPEGAAGAVSPTRPARPAPRRGAAPQAGAGAALPSPDGRDAAAAKVRFQVDAGIEQIEAELQNLQAPPDAQLAALRDRVRRLESLAARHPVALAAPASSLRLIERRIEAGLAESRAAARAQEVDRAAWQRQVAEIEGLIGERSYPEAKRLAKKLAANAAAPPDVAARARELAAQADSALKSIFGGTRFGHEQQQIQKTPPPP